MADNYSYTIWARSPSTRERIREIELNGNRITNRQLAEQRAASFAARLCRERQAKDWVGEIQWEELGIQTLPGYRR